MTAEENKELALLGAIAHGDSVAMRDFYARYSGYLNTVCLRYIYNRDDAKDVLQESFIKIFKAIPSFEYRGAGALRAWLARVVVNDSLKFLRSRNRFDFVGVADEMLPDTPASDEPDITEVPTSVILDMIRALPEGYRTVFNLYVFEGRSHREIAAELQITESTSASQLHRAKQQLAQRIINYKAVKMTQ